MEIPSNVYGLIYKVTNLINNKIYIGQTKQKLHKRISSHINSKSKSKFSRAIKKYGKDNFLWEKIDFASNLIELNNKEIYWIAFYNSYNEGYNSNLGGGSNKGYKHTPEALQKIKNSLTGEKNPNYGKKHTQEERIKMGSGRRGKIPWNKGLTSKQDNRIKCKGHAISEEQKKKQSLLMKGRKLTPEHIHNATINRQISCFLKNLFMMYNYLYVINYFKFDESESNLEILTTP